MKNMDVKYENHKDQETVKLDGKNIPLDCLENQNFQYLSQLLFLRQYQFFDNAKEFKDAKTRKKS